MKRRIENLTKYMLKKMLFISICVILICISSKDTYALTAAQYDRFVEEGRLGNLNIEVNAKGQMFRKFGHFIIDGEYTGGDANNPFYNEENSRDLAILAVPGNSVYEVYGEIDYDAIDYSYEDDETLNATQYDRATFEARVERMDYGNTYKSAIGYGKYNLRQGKNLTAFVKFAYDFYKNNSGETRVGCKNEIDLSTRGLTSNKICPMELLEEYANVSYIDSSKDAGLKDVWDKCTKEWEYEGTALSNTENIFEHLQDIFMCYVYLKPGVDKIRNTIGLDTSELSDSDYGAILSMMYERFGGRPINPARVESGNAIPVIGTGDVLAALVDLSDTELEHMTIADKIYTCMIEVKYKNNDLKLASWLKEAELVNGGYSILSAKEYDIYMKAYQKAFQLYGQDTANDTLLDYGCVLTPDIFESKKSFNEALNDFARTIRNHFGNSSFYNNKDNANYVARSYMMAKKMCENSQFTDITDIYACDMDVVSHTYGYDSSNIILLADTQVVQLNDSYGEDCDTDQDGINDNVEAHTPEEVDITNFLKEYCKYNKYTPEETADMIAKNSKVVMYNYSSNPVLPDSDFDGRDDLRDGRKLNNEYKSIVETNNYNNVEINYYQDYRYFFMDSTKYYPELAEMGMSLANMAYKKYLNFPFSNTKLYKTWKNSNEGERYTANNLSEYMWYFGMDSLYEHLVDYSNLEFYDVPYVIGQHDTIALLGKVNNLERNVITLAIGDCGEDKSAFSYLTDVLTGNTNNINSKIGFYKNEADNVYQALVNYDNAHEADRWKKSYWIVGYGTGGSIANLVAKKFIDYKHSNQNIYCYTYGAPSIVNINNTDDIKDLANLAYKSIFNIENEDDFILKETDRQLGYYKYGWKVNASINTGYYAHNKSLKGKFQKITNKVYSGNMKDSQDYLKSLMIDYKKYYIDAYSKIKNEQKISSAHSEVSYFLLSSYGEKESVYVSNFLRDRSRDSDGDGLPDIWEKLGADINDDGIVDVDLPVMGADPHKKDLFIEIDYMTGYEPNISALQRVVDVFEEHDINMHIDAGPYSINFPNDEELSESEELVYEQTIATEYKSDSYWRTTLNLHFNKNRRDIFRYCVYINIFNDNRVLGISNGIPGNSFVSAKGLIDNDEIKEASNFMHELGHTLGLTHGGAKDDDYVFKPNHLSIMNYLYSNTGLYPTNEINYSEYELPAIDINHVDERKGIDPDGVVDTSLGCKWIIKNNGNSFMQHEQESITNEPIDFNGNNKIEKNCKVDFYFGKQLSDGSLYRDNKARATINEWENLVYKPEEGAMVIENIKLDNASLSIKDIDRLKELPMGAYDILWNDKPNKYDIHGIAVYNEKDNKYYYEITVTNEGKSSTITDISTDSNELKFNLKDFKIELPKHTNNTISVVKIYIPIKENLEEKYYKVSVIWKDVYGTEYERTDILDTTHSGCENIKDYSKVNNELNENSVFVRYDIEDYNNNAFGEKYILPCEAYQKADGTWTSDAVDNFEEYVDQVVEKVDVNGFVSTHTINDTENGSNKNVIYVIGFIILVGIILLIRFVLRIIKTKQDEDF